MIDAELETLSADFGLVSRRGPLSRKFPARRLYSPRRDPFVRRRARMELMDERQRALETCVRAAVVVLSPYRVSSQCRLGANEPALILPSPIDRLG